MNIGRYYLKKFPITSKFQCYCIDNRFIPTKLIIDAINNIHEVNPIIIFNRPIRFIKAITISIDSETYSKYNDLKKLLTLHGLCILINDYIVNRTEYDIAINKSVDIRGLISGKLKEIDVLILEDATLSDKEKNFLIDLDYETKELLYYDREMLKKTEID